MKTFTEFIKLAGIIIWGLVSTTYTWGQCVSPVITSISNTGPVCEGGTLNLSASGTVGGVASSFVRMAGIGANDGNRAFNQVFSTGDRAGSINRISVATFNAYGTAAALRADYDVLLFTWASSTSLNAPWSLINDYLALGGSVFWEDEQNIGQLAPGVIGSRYEGSYGCGYTYVSPSPFPVLSANGVTGCFDNHHLQVSSWPSWMQVYIKGAGGENLGIAGIHPGRGRLIVQGPDQDYHAEKFGDATDRNQYQILLNQLDFLTAEQTGISWTGPGGFTSNEANPIISGVTLAANGVYTATLTNLTGGGCSVSATTTVSVLPLAVGGTATASPSTVCYNTGTTISLSGQVGSIQWQQSTDNSTWNDVVGETTASLSTGNLASITYFRAKVTSGTCGEALSTVAAVSIKPQVAAAGPITGKTIVCPGVTETYSIAAVANATNYLWTVPAGASITGGQGTVSITVNWGTSTGGSVGVTPSNSCAPGAASTVAVTVNSTLTLAVAPVNPIGAGAQPNTIYTGYGPQSLTLQATTTGGTAPYSYLWTGGSTASSLVVTGAGIYTVTVTDAVGCQSSVSVTIRVVDVRCGNKNDKVAICHQTNSTTHPWEQICVSANAVPAQLANGSLLGQCAPTSGGRVAAEEVAGLSITLLANPIETSKVRARVLGATGQPLTVELIDLRGQRVRQQVWQQADTEHLIEWSLSAQPGGEYLLRAVSNDQQKTAKVIKPN